MKIKDIEKFGKIVFSFTVMHSGWEGDTEGWVLTKGNKNILILTNHGVPYEAKPSELSQKITEYKTCIDKTRQALALISL